MNPLPDYSNYSPFFHTHYLFSGLILHSSGQTLNQAAQLETNKSLLQRFTAPLHIIVHNKQRQLITFAKVMPLSTANTRGIGDDDAIA